MSKLAATWHDVDGTKTHHDFETVAEAGTWLESVLSEVVECGEADETCLM